jgi:hypothetical protein
MNGIQSLLPGPQAGPQQAPGQAQPPGQAPMPGMQPPQQQGPQQAAQPLTPMLSQLGIPQLQALLMNPSSQVPKFALLTAIDKKIKEQQAMQAVQGANAQQQAQQQQGTVADQILQMAQQQEQQPVMAAHGGMMRGYSGGGIVAFGNGGPLRFATGSDEQGVQSGATSYPVLTPEELSVNERIKRFIDSLRMGGRETDERSVNERIKAVLPELPELPKRPSRADEREKGARSWQSAAPSEEVDLLGESLIPQPEEPDIGQAPRTAMLGKSGDPDVDIGQILPLSKRGKTGDPNIDAGPKVGLPAAAQLAGEAARQKPPAAPGIAGLSPAALNQLQARKEAEVQAASAQLPEQEALKAAREAQNKAYARESDVFERLMGSLKEQEKDLFSPEALLQMAGSISTKKGELMGSLARGASGYMKSVDEYNKSIAEKRSNLMQLQAARQSAIAERNVALAEGDVTRARAAQDKITQINRYYSDLQRSLEKELFDRTMKEREVTAGEERAKADTTTAAAAQTRAGKETEAEQRERLFKTNRPAFDAIYGKPESGGLTQNQRALLYSKAEQEVLDPKSKEALLYKARAEARKAGKPFDEAAYLRNEIYRRFEARLAAAEKRMPDAGADAGASAMPAGNWGKAQVVKP